MSTPVPDGRGRWRFTLHSRVFSAQNYYPTTTGIGELVDARSRSLTQAWDSAATLEFVLDGHSQTAALIRELQQDVIAWRWDEASGRDIPMFRGPITQSQDEISEQTHTVTFTCHDYFAMLDRRYLTNTTLLGATQQDQDNIVTDLVTRGTNGSQSSSGVSFAPGSLLPLQVHLVNPDGTNRTALSGQLRDRQYTGGSQISNLIDELAKVIGGFDYDVLPRSDLSGVDFLRIFYPSQGITRANPVLVYGSTVSTVSRSVNSADYANYWRVLGNNGNDDPAAAQLYGEAWNTDSNNVSVIPVGLWMNNDNAADVVLQNTLTEKANGNLAISGVLIPAYTLGLRPGFYSYGLFNMGDTLPLVIQSGRLNVNTTIRVLGITYTIGDDGQEDVDITVGRAPVTLADILSAASQDINALARR